ncbi:MAG: peptide deformylase [Desulfobacteraceae bacterium]
MEYGTEYTGDSNESMKIYTYPAEVLRNTAQPVTEITGRTQQLIDGMAKTMYAAPGIGLAANQVGSLHRIIVFDLTPREDGPKLQVLINPEIIEAEGEITYEESCLSVIDYSAEVTRSARVHVQGWDRDGRPVELEAEGILAVCLQHEIDHLDGVLYIDHISNLKRALYKKKLKKLIKKNHPPG